MRFSFPTNVYREEKKLVMYAFVYVYMDTLLSIYFATLITREEKHENFKRNVLIRSIFSFFSHVRGTGTIFHFLLW